MKIKCDMDLINRQYGQQAALGTCVAPRAAYSLLAGQMAGCGIPADCAVCLIRQSALLCADDQREDGRCQDRKEEH